jgi:hypothetical protein
MKTNWSWPRGHKITFFANCKQMNLHMGQEKWSFHTTFQYLCVCFDLDANMWIFLLHYMLSIALIITNLKPLLNKDQ